MISDDELHQEVRLLLLEIFITELFVLHAQNPTPILKHIMKDYKKS